MPVARGSGHSMAIGCLPASGWEVPAEQVSPVSSELTSPVLSRAPPSTEDAACLQSTRQEDGASERGADSGTNLENRKHGWLLKGWLIKSLLEMFPCVGSPFLDGL